MNRAMTLRRLESMGGMVSEPQGPWTTLIEAGRQGLAIACSVQQPTEPSSQQDRQSFGPGRHQTPASQAETLRVSGAAPVRPTVLIADDDAILRRAVRSMLEEQGFSVIAESEDGPTAVAAARCHCPDVILMDVKMPGMSGIEATQVIKGILPRVQVIMLSAYEDVALQQSANEAGAFSYMVKGSSPSLICQAILQAWSQGGKT